MAIFIATVKSSVSRSGVRLEKGMSVEFVSQLSNPINRGGQEISDAFVRKYGIDINKAGLMSWISVQRIS